MRKPPRVVSADPADAGAADSSGACSAARCPSEPCSAMRRLSPRPAFRSSRSGGRGRLPPGAWLSDEADGPRRSRGGGALRRARSRAWARPRVGRSTAEAPRVTFPSSRSAPAGPRASSMSTRVAGFARKIAAAPAGDRRGALARSPPRIRYRRARPSSRAASIRSASSSRPVSGICSRSAVGRARLSGVADRFRQRAARSWPSPSGLRPRRRLGPPLAGLRTELPANRGHRAPSPQPSPLPPRGPRRREGGALDRDREVRRTRPRLPPLARIRGASRGDRPARTTRADRSRGRRNCCSLRG